MAYLQPYRQELVSRHLKTGGSVAAICGPRRSGLTWCVDALVPQWRTESALDAPTILIDLKETQTPDALLPAIVEASNSETYPTNGRELAEMFREASGNRAGLWYFRNFHRATSDAQKLVLSACLDRRLPHGTRALSSFVLEGAVDFEAAIETHTEGTTHQPLLANVEPATPWRTVVEVEETIARLSTAPHPRALVAWLADVTRGDTGFCNELLLRLSDPAPTWEQIQSAYNAIVLRGPTARELRAGAASFSATLIEALLNGAVLPGLGPPDGSTELTGLHLGGIAEYDPLVSGYRLRSPMVGDALCAEGEWERHLSPPEPITGRCGFVFWQVATVEVLLRTLTQARAAHNDALAQTTVPAPWRGKEAEVRRGIARLLEDAELDPSLRTRLMGEIRSCLKEHLPDQLPAAEVAQSVLERAGVASGATSLLDGLAFSELVNLAKRMDIVTTDEREVLDVVNARRNDAAHFRPTPYDQAFRLEQLIHALLPDINARNVEPEER